MRWSLPLVLLAFLAGCDRPVTPASVSTTDARVERARGAPDVVGRDALAAENDALSRLRAELERKDARIRELEATVAAQSEQRVAREREWLEYTQTIAKLSSIAGLQNARFEPLPDPNGAPAGQAAPSEPPAEQVAPSEPPDGAASDSARADAAARERDAEIRTSLRALFVAEQVSGLEVLESGRLAEGAIGPVVLRATDERGRTVGTLCAERLRLEASVSARSVTLVLEDGYERRGGERIPFARAADESSPEARPAPEEARERAGRRRIELPHVDPRPWIEALPELFREADRAPPPDDGRWNLLAVRAGLNLLLRQDVSAGAWRLCGLAGVQEGVLRDVQLDQLDEDGAILRKLFADRMRILAAEKGVRIELESGAVLRGDSKTPFLDGRYTIFLPRADLGEWRTAGVPGLSDAPPRR